MKEMVALCLKIYYPNKESMSAICGKNSKKKSKSFKSLMLLIPLRIIPKVI